MVESEKEKMSAITTYLQSRIVRADKLPDEFDARECSCSGDGIVVAPSGLALECACVEQKRERETARFARARRADRMACAELAMDWEDYRRMI
jgi:hypothetical protein